jgi:hypothetical protein
MSVATVKLVSEQFMAEFYSRGDQVGTARSLQKDGWYRVLGSMGIHSLAGEDVAEEVFDLSNNPSRQAERDLHYGPFRSVSVGDIVNVDGQDYLCASMGWIEL